MGIGSREWTGDSRFSFEGNGNSEIERKTGGLGLLLLVVPAEGMIVVPIVLPRVVEVGFPHRGMAKCALLLFFLGVLRRADGERRRQQRNSTDNHQGAYKLLQMSHLVGAVC